MMKNIICFKYSSSVNNDGKEESTEERMKQEMLLQLHEQYAQNNNANLSSVIGLITATIVILGFYGYVFVNSTLDFAKDLGSLTSICDYTIDALVLITTAVFIVIGFLQYICLYQGTHQRFEQFITYAIRCKYNLVHTDNVMESEKDKIFPKEYHPFKKEEKEQEEKKIICFNRAFLCPNRNMQSIVQGLFGELVKIFSLILWCVGIPTVVKVICAIIQTSKSVEKDTSLLNLTNIIIIICLILVFLGVNAFIANKAIKLRRDYFSYCNEFKEYNPLNKNENKTIKK